MFKFQQYHARATERGELVKGPTSNKQADRDKLPSTEATLSDARWVAAALSRWDNEGGAVRDEPSI